MSRLTLRFVLFAGLAIILFFSYSTFFDSSRQIYHCDLDLDSIQADNSRTEWSHGSLVDAGLQPFAINPTPKHVVSGVLKAFPTLPIVEEPKKQDEVKKPEPKEKDKQKKKPELDAEATHKLREDKWKEGGREKEYHYKEHKFNSGTFDIPADISFSAAGPKPNEIVLLTASDGKGHNGGIEGILDDVGPNRQEYVDLHGYIYQFINITKYDIAQAHPVWAKLPAIVDAFNMHPQAKYVWWLDLDAIIMTPTIDINEHLLKPDVLYRKTLKGLELNKSGGGHLGVVTAREPDMSKIDLIISQDHNGLNAGSFMLRRSEFTRLLIDMWSDPYFVMQNFQGQEQDALSHLVKEHPTILEHVSLVRQKEFNGYAIRKVTGMSWEKGDFVVHFAGCWVTKSCNRQWKEFMALRTPVSAVKEQALQS